TPPARAAVSLTRFPGSRPCQSHPSPTVTRAAVSLTRFPGGCVKWSLQLLSRCSVEERVESGCGCLHVEGRPGTCVEGVRGALEIVAGELGEVGALGEPVPQQPVGVLVAASLPG